MVKELVKKLVKKVVLFLFFFYFIFDFFDFFFHPRYPRPSLAWSVSGTRRVGGICEEAGGEEWAGGCMKTPSPLDS